MWIIRAALLLMHHRSLKTSAQVNSVLLLERQMFLVIAYALRQMLPHNIVPIQSVAGTLTISKRISLFQQQKFATLEAEF